MTLSRWYLLQQRLGSNLDNLLYEWRNSVWREHPLNITHPLPEGDQAHG